MQHFNSVEFFFLLQLQLQIAIQRAYRTLKREMLSTIRVHYYSVHLFVYHGASRFFLQQQQQQKSVHQFRPKNDGQCILHTSAFPLIHCCRLLVFF